MKKWLDAEAVIAVDAGAGWMSRYELGLIAPGSVVRSATEAGTGCPISLNGTFFAQGSVAVIDGSGRDGLLCAFIDSFEEAEPRSARPRRGDRAIELVPFAIRLGSARARLSELDGTGVYSLINLGRRIGSTCDAELVVAGSAVASGTVAVVGENMALRVERLVAELPTGSFPRTTGAVLAPGYSAERVKDYNFRMPDSFTKRAIDRFRDIHLEFLRSFQTRFPSLSGWTLSLVDQLNYGEWLDDVAGRSMAVAAFLPARRERSYERESPARMPDTFLVEGTDCAERLEGSDVERIRSWAARWLSGGEDIPFQLALDAKAAPVAGDPDFEITLACLRSGWLDIGDLRIGADSGSKPATLTNVPYLRDPEDRARMILLARFMRTDGARMDIVYPQGLLAPYLPALGR